MPKFNDPAQPNKVGKPGAPKTASGVPLIIEPKCLVCKSPHRHLVDKMLVAGLTYSEIERQFAFAGIKRRSIANHKENHLGYEEAGIRSIIEQEALAAQRNHEEGVSRVITKNAYLEVAMQKAYDQLLDGSIDVPVADAVKVIEQLQKLQEQNQNVALDELQVQFQMFMQAVKELIERDKWSEIVGRTAELLRATGRDVPWSDGNEKEPVAIEEVVDAEVVA